jgi:phage gp45-like
VASASRCRYADPRVAEPEPPPDTSISLAGDRRLVLRREAGGDALTLLERDGRVAVTVTITGEAVTLHLGGARVEIEVEKSLAIAAQSISLHGREGVSITTEGALATTARSQSITSTHGNVEVDANDDVKLNGERILLNC